MYFKRIELNGFKSFADPVVLEFTDGITCIVGPNGSGKSNISDAVRWVLGEQSPKMLRGGKMEEVIFAGTQNRKPKGMAEVTLVLDNAAGILPIDFAEVAITRRMYRSGESEYMINHSPCRLRDIRELIMDTGIGVEGYSIIGQGKIADIISNKMESRREIFEEAAGIVKYRTKKAETERKLENAADNLDRVNDIVKEIEERIGDLEEDSKKASEFLILRDRYKKTEINITLKNIDSVEEKDKAIRQELSELETAITQGKSAKELLDNELRQKRAAAEELEHRSDAIRDSLLKKTEEIHELLNREELNKERMTSLTRDWERLLAELSVIEERLQRESANGEEFAKSRKGVDEESAKYTAILKEKQKTAAELSATLSEKESLLESKKSMIFELSGKVGAKKSEIQSITSLKGTLTKRLDRLESDSVSDFEGGKDTAAEMQRLRALFESEAKDVLKNTTSLQTVKRELQEEVQELSSLGSRIEEFRIAKGRTSARRKLLEELENAYEGYAGGVRFLMKQNLSGLIGVVGDILKVPKGYEVAIETALGASLQNIVCKDDSCAKTAIALLKENEAGRLTFLPVGNIRAGRQMPSEALQSQKGYIGVASDIVSCREDCRNVLDYLLGRVILCDSLDHAVSLSKHSDSPFRFVTPQGEIINAAGAITGGSLRNNTGNILSRKAEMEELALKLSDLEKELSAAEDSREIKIKFIALKQAEQKQLEEDVRKAEMSQAVRHSEIQQLEAQTEEASQSSNRRMLELEDLKQEIESANKSIQILTDEINSLDQEILSLNKETVELAEKSSQIRQEVLLAKEEETSARMDQSNVFIRIQSADELERRVKAAIEDLLAQKTAKEAEKNSVQEQLSKLEGPEGNSPEALALKEQEKASLEKELSEIQDKRLLSGKNTEAMEERRSAADQELYSKQMQKHEADIRLAKLDTQMETLKEKLWEEFEISYVQAMTFASDEFVMSRALKESREIKDRMRELGDVNIGAIKEYEQVSQRYLFLKTQKEDLLQAMSELKSIIQDMDATIRQKFKESFDAVVENFEKVFEELFGGGHAKLTLEDPSNPLETNIEIEAQPPGKKLQNITLLSGGEKTMTAIALMFAVLKAKPTPFCILDEVEAALDDTNIDCFARYLRKFEKTQFALVTHQKATMEYANVLYGVTMPEPGITKILSLKLGESF